MRWLAELKRRHVLRVAVGYAVTSWLLIEVADTIFPRLQLPEWTVTLVIAVLALGFPLALVFAWFFELTPEGLQRAEPATPPPHEVRAQLHFSGRRLDYLVIALLAIALGYFFWESRLRQSEFAAGSASEPVSVAVLPFTNISPDPDQEYFSDGLTEELLNMLARIAGLRVAARNSSFRFKGTHDPVSEIGQALNVRYLLTGSIRKASETLRISAQIVKVDDGYVLWSQSYDRALDDIFQIQKDIATAVTGSLKVKLLNADEEQHIDPAAYNLVLRGRYLGQRFDIESAKQAIAAYQQAIAIDPDYAAAWANLSKAQASLADYGAVTPDEAYSAARHSAEKALELDPDLADAHLALAWVQQLYDRNWPAVQLRLQRAYELEPGNARILRRLGDFQWIIGDTGRAIAFYERALKLDPLDRGTHHNLGLAYQTAGRFTDAERHFRAALSLDKGGAFRHAMIGSALLLQGRIQESLAEIEQETQEFWRLLYLAMVYHSLGRSAESNALLAQVEKEFGNEWAFQIAEAHAWRDEADLAFAWYERARRQNDGGIIEIKASPYFRKLDTDPRYLAFLAEMNFPHCDSC